MDPNNIYSWAIWAHLYLTCSNLAPTYIPSNNLILILLLQMMYFLYPPPHATDNYENETTNYIFTPFQGGEKFLGERKMNLDQNMTL